jgi:ketosteroid isomerase-like protein
MRLSLPAMAVLLALAACAPKEAEVEEAPAEPMSEVGANAMRDAFVNTYMSKNAAGAAAFYSENAVMYGPDGAVVNGRPAIEAEFTKMLQAGVDSVGLTKSSFTASGDEAVEEGTFIMRTLDPKTKEASYAKGGYKVTYGRQPDGLFQVVKDSTWVTERLVPR